MNILRILVIGDFASGKTEFIKNVSQQSFSTEKDITNNNEKNIKSQTTVAMDFGKVNMEDTEIHLIGTPGQERFDFMIDILKRNISGIMLIVDSSNIENIKNGAEILKKIKLPEIPVMVGCNKQDLIDALPLEKIKDILNLEEISLVPLIAKDKESSTEFLKSFIKKLVLHPV